MIDRDLQKLVVHRSWNQMPMADRAEGIYIWDQDGNKYLDGAAGSSVVVNIGHGVRSVVDAMYEQAKKVSYAAPHVFSNEPSVRLGQIIASKAPGTLRNNVRSWISVTGTDSTDDAARLSRQYFVATGKGTKYIIVSRWQAFHGNNLAVAGFSGITARRRTYYPMFVDSPHIPPAYCYRCPFGDLPCPECGMRCARALETTINQVGAENIAAFIAEPVVGAALGAVPAPDGYFEIIRDICDRHDVLLIVDEVMTAWGRIGNWFGIEQWGVTPDIIATAKGLTSGYAPLAATIAREDLWQAIEQSGNPFLAGHTMNHNPVSCAGALASIGYVEEHNLLENSREMGKYLIGRLEELLAFDMVGDVRGRGLMCGMEFVKNKETKEPFDPKLRVSLLLQRECMKRGLLLFSCSGSVEGVAGDMMLVTPPLIINKQQIDEMIDIMKEALAATEAQLRA
jgi:adenosylmethionine-8-amino-7-oxononanoate aminotransferase